MITSLLRLLSHLLFIYLVHHLLMTTVDWSKCLKVTRENQSKIRLLVLFLAIGFGYLVSTFFLELILVGQSLTSV